MLRQPRSGTRVHVVWEDCFSVDEWTTAGVLLSREPWKVDVVGWFLGRTKSKAWVISSGVTTDTNGGVQGGCTWVVPQPMIRSWEAIDQ